MKTEWKPIRGYEGRYEVSNTGYIRSLCRTVDIKGRLGARVFRGRILSPKTTTRGYAEVNLSKNGRGKSHYVHRLVAAAFCPPNEGNSVNHRDGNQLNNRADNLEWVTQAENINHAVATGLRKKRCTPIESVDPVTGEVKKYPSMGAAARLLGRRTSSSIQRAILHGGLAHGLNWKIEGEIK